MTPTSAPAVTAGLVYLDMLMREENVFYAFPVAAIGTEHWNGWARPGFTKEQADAFVAVWNSYCCDHPDYANCAAKYVTNGADASYYVFPQPEGDPQVFPLERNLYWIGAGFWTWSVVPHHPDEIGDAKFHPVAATAFEYRLRENTLAVDVQSVALQLGSGFMASARDKQLAHRLFRIASQLNAFSARLITCGPDEQERIALGIGDPEKTPKHHYHWATCAGGEADEAAQCGDPLNCPYLTSEEAKSTQTAILRGNVYRETS